MEEDIIVDQDIIDDPNKDKVKEPVNKDEGGKIKIGDEEYSLEDVQSWREDSTNKSNWQKELTQKSQKISDESKELDRAKAMREFLNDPDNKGKVDKIQAIVNGQKDDLPPEDEFESEETKALRTKLDTLETQIKGIQESGQQRDLTNIQREIDNEKKQVKVDNPQLDDEEIDMIEAMTIKAQTGSEDIVKISDIAKKYIDASVKRKENIIKNYLNRKEEDAQNFTEHGSTPPPAKDRKISLEDGSAKKEFAKTIAGMQA